MVYISALRIIVDTHSSCLSSAGIQVIVDTHSLFMELIANKDTHSGLL